MSEPRLVWENVGKFLHRRNSCSTESVLALCSDTDHYLDHVEDRKQPR